MYEVETMVGEDAMSSSIIPFPCYRVTRKSKARYTIFFVEGYFRSGKFGPLVDRRPLRPPALPTIPRSPRSCANVRVTFPKEPV